MERLVDWLPLWQLLLRARRAHGACEKRWQAYPDVCSASDRDPRTRRRRGRGSGSPEREESRGLQPWCEIADGYQTLLSPDIVKGFLPFASLSSLGLKDEKKKCFVCVRVCGRAVSAWDLESSRMNRKRQRGLSHAHNYIFMFGLCTECGYLCEVTWLESTCGTRLCCTLFVRVDVFSYLLPSVLWSVVKVWKLWHQHFNPDAPSFVTLLAVFPWPITLCKTYLSQSKKLVMETPKLWKKIGSNIFYALMRCTDINVCRMS